MEYYHGNSILLHIVFYIWVLEEIMRERVNEGKSEGEGGRQREGRRGSERSIVYVSSGDSCDFGFKRQE